MTNSLSIKDAIHLEIEKIEDEPLRSIFKDDLHMFWEFLEQETDMDWQRFLCLVRFLASEYLDMYEAQEIWGDE